MGKERKQKAYPCSTDRRTLRGCIPANKFSVPVDYESLTALGAIMGSGGMVVMDQDNCMVDVARYFGVYCSRILRKMRPCRKERPRCFDPFGHNWGPRILRIWKNWISSLIPLKTPPSAHWVRPQRTRFLPPCSISKKSMKNTFWTNAVPPVSAKACTKPSAKIPVRFT